MASTKAKIAYLADDRRVERVVLALLVARRPGDAEIQTAMDQIEGLDPSVEASGYLIAAADLLRELARRSPISVGVPAEDVDRNVWPSTMRYTMERRIMAPVEKAPVPRIAAKTAARLDAVRLALGVRLNRVYFPLTAASRTLSYHLEVEGPVGTYFGRGELLEPEYVDGDYTLQVQEQHGQRRVHVYIGHAKARDDRYYGAQFYERAPGSFATAVVAGVVSTVLILTLGLMSVQPLVAGQPDRISGIVPALLALPIAIAAFVGLESATGRRHPSLLSRCYSLAIAVVSLVAFVLAFLRPGVPPQFWIAVMTASLLSTSLALVSWLIRLSIENAYVQRNR